MSRPNAETFSSPEKPDWADWTGNRFAAPPFDRIRVAEFKPALTAAMAQNRAEIEAITANNAPATFENTLAALENAGRTLGRVSAMFGVWTSTQSDTDVRAIEQEMAPVLAGFHDEVVQNAALFGRVEAVHESRTTSRLTAEEQRLTEVIYRRFARQGAALDTEAKARLAEINRRLATLGATFSQNELADEESRSLILTDPSDLAGLSESLINAAAAAARAAGHAEGWLIANSRSSVEPFLIYSSRRDLRERAFRMWTGRCDSDDAHDNNAVIVETLRLRAEKARLLGFDTFAHWIADDQMAKTPQTAMDLMLKIWEPAKARALEEIAAAQAIADQEDPGVEIEPWDYRYYAEKVRKATYDLDANDIKPYLQLYNLRDGMFWAAGQLFGLSFVRVDDLPTVDPSVSVYEMRRGDEHAGLFYFDPLARAGKQSGAWMSEYRTQERFIDVVSPIVSNNANFVRGAPDEPLLVSWDDAVTLFHEFGHALHGLMSNVSYPTLAGTNVARDFVELPSQLFERWLPTSDLLRRFARHFQTDEPMPTELVEKIRRAHAFNRGFDTVEYLASAIVDMKAHLAVEPPTDPRAFEAQVLREIGMPRAIVMRHRMPHFGHIFAGEGYAAGYYDYIWADTLTADAAEAFAEAPQGFYDKDLAARLRDCIVGIGNAVEAGEAFRRFRGRDVTIDALMRDRGFPIVASA